MGHSLTLPPLPHHPPVVPPTTTASTKCRLPAAAPSHQSAPPAAPSVATISPLRHTTQAQREEATGLRYFNARYYDPELGMFISPDTIVLDPTNAMDYNRYAYARGNPNKYNDQSGH